MDTTPSDLPVMKYVPAIRNKLNAGRVLVLQAPPGAGKSTVLPLELLDEKWLEGKKIIMLEPRRLAARAVATRMAFLLQEDVGDTVGYRIRFETKISSRTRIEVVTEGILTRMIQSDSMLEGAGLVIFDEFHERSLHADLALALCLQVQQLVRDDLRILIMSATLDGDKLSKVLNAPVVNCEGRQYPVTVRYPGSDEKASLPQQMANVIRKALSSEEGDVLAFLPGGGEIKRTQELLESSYLPATVYPLYGDLPYQKQQEAIQPLQGKRKVVLATSIAETSLTIEGISIVVDSGYSRVPRFDPRTGLTRLDTVRVTKDAADQRAGRAGRLGPGTCYRLWTEGEHLHLNPHRVPEILDADLSSLLLELSQWGIKTMEELIWITPPPQAALSRAKELLFQLEAIVENMKITEKGRQMLRLPTHPRIAHMLLEAKENSVKSLSAAIDIASLLEERDPLPRESGADISLRLEVLRKWRNKERVNADRSILQRVEKFASSWRKIFSIKEDNSPFSETETGRLIFAAYPERIARQTETNRNAYRMENGRLAVLQPHDPLAACNWIAIAHLDAGNREGKIFLAAPFDPEEIADKMNKVDKIEWVPEKEAIEGAAEYRIGNIVAGSKPLNAIPESECKRIWLEILRKEGIEFLKPSAEFESWRCRIMSLRKWRPEEKWPDLSDSRLLSDPEEWLGPFIGNITKLSRLRQLDLKAMISVLLPWELHAPLDELAPEKIIVPSGSWIKINYFPDGNTPEMHVRLQEVFGLCETPSVNRGRTKVLLHLLSPGYKPVQVTQDLESFWKNTYPEVKKELRIRYSKHSWPEDPRTAQAVRGVRKNSR